MDRQMNEWMDRRRDEWMDRQMKWVDGLMNRWMGEWIDICVQMDE